MVNTDVTVLTTGGVCGSSGVDIDSVEGTKVSTNTADLIFKHLVVETGLEFTLASGGSCDIHGGLTTTEDHVVLLWGNACGVERGISGVGFEDGEVASGHELKWLARYQDRDSREAYLGSLVLGSGDEVGAVGGELDVVNLVVELVGLDVLQLLARLILVNE